MGTISLSHLALEHILLPTTVLLVSIITSHCLYITGVRIKVKVAGERLPGGCELNSTDTESVVERRSWEIEKHYR